ncbi:MAG: tetratricopeptide repeat protein [Deltaproteobacteria bacterium]|nr:tetratricopeptide repeat protein [Deltaproteobacteria bacterium]
MMSTKDCMRAFEIELRRAQELNVDPGDSRFYEEHLKTCADCGLEHQSLDILADEETSGALPSLDDLARRRLVEDVIAQADELVLDEDENSETASRKTRGRLRTIGFGVGLAAASIAAILLLSNPAAPPVDQPTGQTTALQQAATSIGTFALLSGDVLVGAQGAMIGDHLTPGDRLVTGDGRSVVQLPTDISLSIGPQTRLVLHEREDSALEVLLEEGQIQVSLAPDTDRPGFSVVTEKGQIEVKGTIFSVSAQQLSVEVRVLRGEVEIADRSGKQRRLGTHAGTALGDSRVWTLSRQEEETLWEEVRAIDLLNSEDNAVVEIQSEPTGAVVTVDSVILGRTPVSAAVRAGYREIALAIDEEQLARKLVDLNSDARVSWSYKLAETGPGTAGVEQPQATESLSRPAPVSIRESSARESSTRESSARESSAQALLSKAQSLRAERDWVGAARIYRKLIKKFPGSDETRASLVSFGEIQLKKLGKPSSALKQFNRYLSTAGNGPLAQEALFGKARALRKLDRTSEEKTTLESFLARFPSAIQAREARERLAAIGNVL